MNKYLIISIVVLVGLLAALISRNDYLKRDRNRLSENFEQTQRTNQILTLSVDEYKLLNTKASAKLDSVIQANKIKPNRVITATITEIQYKDTGSTKIVYKTIEKLPTKFKIPFEVSEECWGVKGSILTTDSKAKIEIKEKTANNSVQAVITRKKFLFWYRKKQTLQVFSDCGEVNVTQINFKK